MEIFFRTTIQKAKASDISAMPPTQYANRFLDFFKKHVFVELDQMSDASKAGFIDIETKRMIRM